MDSGLCGGSVASFDVLGAIWEPFGLSRVEVEVEGKGKERG